VSDTPIKAINHITFAVRDLDASITFYHRVLGFKLMAAWRHGAYLRTADIWLVLMCSAEREGPIKELVTGSFKASSIAHADTHVAFLVSGEDFGALCERIVDSGAPTRHEQTTLGPVLFFGDPDGHKLEFHVGSMTERVRAMRHSNYDGMIHYGDAQEDEDAQEDKDNTLLE